jgi:hypothetical protein
MTSANQKQELIIALHIGGQKIKNDKTMGHRVRNGRFQSVTVFLTVLKMHKFLRCISRVSMGKCKEFWLTECDINVKSINISGNAEEPLILISRQ